MASEIDKKLLERERKKFKKSYIFWIFSIKDHYFFVAEIFSEGPVFTSENAVC